MSTKNWMLSKLLPIGDKLNDTHLKTDEDMKDASETKVHLTSLLIQSGDQETVSESDQETVSESAITDKSLYKIQPRRTLDDGEHPLRSTVESISSLSTGKATDDGYNWRKYGQKLVKGNVCVRSYYKCTNSNCQAKRQVERSLDGHLIDIKYMGTHEHAKPLVSPPQVIATDLSVTSKSKAEDDGIIPVDIAHPVEPCLTRKPEHVDSRPHKVVLQHNDDSEENRISKKPKIETFPRYDNTVRKTYCESRHVVHTLSEVDLIDDGYSWRKYGQKLVKGSPNPRSYYRCTKAGCEAKKHVERASHDSRIVITTYEGKHEHAMSTASRDIINRSASESAVDCKSVGGESRSKLPDHKSFEIQKLVDVGVQTD